MPSYFFPILGIRPGFQESLWESGEIAVRRRLFPVSTFDLATLATKHTLHIPYQLMDVYLPECQLELEVRGASDFQVAADRVQIVRMLLYVHGVVPFLLPFCTTYSVNCYAGVNARDSATLRSKLPPEMEKGLTSEDSSLEAWPVDMSMSIIQMANRPNEMTKTMCESVVSEFSTWTNLEAKHPVLNLVRKMTNSAPTIPDAGSSILHMWQAIESMFQTVNGELSFRLSLLISQLCAGLAPPSGMYREAKAAYNVRSKIAHGGGPKMTGTEWAKAWSILISCVAAIIQREELPSDENLLEELLDDS